MKGILFNNRYGLEDAVLNGNKTRTWRADKQPRYEVGEVVAIKMAYKKVCVYDRDFLSKREFICEDGSIRTDILFSAGWKNKMFVKNELMPHHIRITAVKKCRLQDLTDEDCIKEGIYLRIISIRILEIAYCFLNGKYCETPKRAFSNLINKLNGKGYWESNPVGYAYEFELVNPEV
jgi:hypothetical protein